VLLSAAEPEPRTAAPPEAGAPAAVRAAGVRDRGEGVELDFRPPRGVVVHLTVATEADGQRLGALVMAMPEFDRYRLGR